MNRNEAISGLVNYALEKEMIQPEEKAWAVNGLLDILQLDAFSWEEGEKAELTELLDTLLDDAYERGVLEENSVVRFYRTTASDGKNYQVQHFSLPLILAVGYRVRSPRGTQFRQWATQTLQEYLIKGFVMDDERLKNPPVVHRLYPTISMRCWSASAIFAPANAVFICECGRFLH